MESLKYLAEQEDADGAAKERLQHLRLFFVDFYTSLDRLLRLLAAGYLEDARQENGAESPVPIVQGICASRVADDLRVLWLVAERGLVAQAYSVNASVMEAALTAAMIGNDPSAAKRWIEWADPKNAPYKASVLWSNALGPTSGDHETILYRAFCLGKHMNPLLQLQVATATSHAGYVLRADHEFPSGTYVGIVKALDFGLTTVMRAVLKTLESTEIPGPDPEAVMEAIRCTVEAQKEVFEALMPWYADPDGGAV